MSDAAPQTILFVCVGNICRSPYMAYTTRALLAERETRAIRIRSAGIEAREGRPISLHMSRLLNARDIETAEFRSHRVTQGELEDADIVITADRGISRYVSHLAPAAAARTFALLQLERLLITDAAGERPEHAPGVTGILERATRARGRAGASSAADDVPDPWGRRRGVYIRAVRRMDPALRLLVGQLT